MNKNQLYGIFYLWLLIYALGVFLPLFVTNLILNVAIGLASFALLAVLLLSFIEAIYPEKSE